MGLDKRNPVFGDLRTTKALSCRLISSFVVCFLESMTVKLATSEISIFLIVSVAEETGLSLALWKNLKDRFCRVEAQIEVSQIRETTSPKSLPSLNPACLKKC